MSRFATALVLAAIAVAASATPALGGARPYDFNGDLRQELAVAMPQWQSGDGSTAGAAIVVRSNRKGLRRSAQLLSLDTPGLRRFATPNRDLIGGVASGDFDNDGYADLVIAGHPGMIVVYGSRDGLDPNRAQDWRRAGTRFQGPVAGDVDDDGYADLAVNVGDDPGRGDGGTAIIRGGPGGLSSTRSALLEASGELQIADLDRDRMPDLAFAGYDEIGVCRGTPSGPRGCAAIPAASTLKDLAVGNVTGDGDREMVVGLPYGSGFGPGAVHVFRLTGDGVRYSFKITQSTRGVPGNNQENDRFGSSVAVGRIGRGGRADIAIGASGENGNRGRVTIVRGAYNRVSRRGNRSFSLATRGIPGRHVRGARLGDEVTLLDHDGDGRLDLDAGAPGYNREAGLVISVPGNSRGVATRRARSLTMASIGFSPSLLFNFGQYFGRR